MNITTKQTKLILQLIKENIVRNYYTGSGRYARKSADYVSIIEFTLKAIGFSPTIHFLCENDAPRGGWQGNYIKLTKEGAYILNYMYSQITEEKLQNEKKKIKAFSNALSLYMALRITKRTTL